MYTVQQATFEHLQLSLVITTKEMVGKRAKGREVKFIHKKVEEPQFAIGAYLAQMFFPRDLVKSCHSPRPQRSLLQRCSLGGVDLKWPTEVICNICPRLYESLPHHAIRGGRNGRRPPLCPRRLGFLPI